jgi:hypothetical protein
MIQLAKTELSQKIPKVVDLISIGELFFVG